MVPNQEIRMDARIRIVALGLILVGFGACTTAGDPLFEERDIVEIPAGAFIGFEEHVLPLFNNRCNNCHGAAGLGGLRLDSYENALMAGNDGDAPIPCDPDNSFLYQKVSMEKPPSGVQMPMAAAPLQPEEQQLIYDWIAQGALQNAGPGGCGGPGPVEDGSTTDTETDAGGDTGTTTDGDAP